MLGERAGDLAGLMCEDTERGRYEMKKEVLATKQVRYGHGFSSRARD